MTALVECVANVSVGRDSSLVETCRRAILSGKAALLHYDVGVDADRTVFTFAGSPETVVASALALGSIAAEKIDIGRNRGNHPRIGSLDICPFVPLANITMSEVVTLSKRYAAALWEECHLPSFLYAESASKPLYRHPRDLRRGGLSGVTKAIEKGSLTLTHGSMPHATAGVSIIGARPPMVAVNFDLNPEVSLAETKQIARHLRSLRSSAPVAELSGVDVIGWETPERGGCQLSFNLRDLYAGQLSQLWRFISATFPMPGPLLVGVEFIGLVPETVLEQRYLHHTSSSQPGLRKLPLEHSLEHALVTHKLWPLNTTLSLNESFNGENIE